MIKIIKLAETELTSLIVIVPKKDAILCFCVECLNRNVVATSDSYTLPWMDKCIDSLVDSKIFFTLDANACYWRIKLRKRDCERTVFTSNRCWQQCIKIFCRLHNATATSQGFTDVVFLTVMWQYIMLHLDDIFIFSGTSN